MARITVEDCLKRIPNRFELTLSATYRARMLAQGHTARVDSKDKPTVTALREIAAGKVASKCCVGSRPKRRPVLANALRGISTPRKRRLISPNVIA